jgi:hypothetical protein
MAVGDEQDIYNRLIDQLPSWFGTSHPVLDVLLSAYVSTAYYAYNSQVQYLPPQMRLQTAYGDNLDLISEDYFGDSLPRHVGETDDSFRARISANLLQERATRRGMDNALFILTGYHPIIFEPWRPFDTGGYNCFPLAYADPSTPGSGFGSYGSGSYPYQGFVDVFVDQYQGMGVYSGYNVFYGGYNDYGTPAEFWYGGESLLTTITSDDDIYQTINLTKVYGTLIWVAIHRVTNITSFDIVLDGDGDYLLDEVGGVIYGG